MFSKLNIKYGTLLSLQWEKVQVYTRITITINKNVYIMDNTSCPQAIFHICKYIYYIIGSCG